MQETRAPLLAFSPAPGILSWGSIGGKMEAAGPLRDGFDELEQDSFFGQRTWEQAESAMQRRALGHALRKAGAKPADLDALLGGDLLNQCTAASFAVRNTGVPFCGLYGACSTMGEGLLLGAALVSGGFARRLGVMTSSHFCSAERQYRGPVPYGSQRTPTAQWTATAAGCCLLEARGGGPRITHGLMGRVIDLGITDAANMGAAMAPAAVDTLERLFALSGRGPGDYDRIFTGDLGAIGHQIVAEQLARDGYPPGERYCDCGLMLYARRGQDMHAGGSGAGCSAAVLCGYILDQLRKGAWRRVLFAPTGALLSPTTAFQGQSIPGICHAVVLESGTEE